MEAVNPYFQQIKVLPASEIYTPTPFSPGVLGNEHGRPTLLQLSGQGDVPAVKQTFHYWVKQGHDIENYFHNAINPYSAEFLKIY